jgi:hypothetical protein
VHNCFQSEEVFALSHMITSYDAVGISGTVLHEIKSIEDTSDTSESSIQIADREVLMNYDKSISREKILSTQ